MDKSKLSYHLEFLKKQIDEHQNMLSSLWGLEAMFEPLLAGHLLDFPTKKLHDYIGVMDALAVKAIQLHERLLDELINAREVSTS